jgi:hypothetical protein
MQKARPDPETRDPEIRGQWSSSEMKKGLHRCNPFQKLARPAGFEPTTPWFVAKYSIQLSYGRMKRGEL